jgi:hypothetical protein
LAFLQDSYHVVGVEIVKRKDKLIVVEGGGLNGVLGVGAANLDYFIQLALFTRYGLFF